MAEDAARELSNRRSGSSTCTPSADRRSTRRRRCGGLSVTSWKGSRDSSVASTALKI
jgi:hypothetical protein